MTAMLWIIAAMALLNAAMIVLTLGLKVARTAHQRRLRASSERFEAALNDLILTGSADDVLLRPNRRDMDLLATKMVEYLSLLRGEQRARLADLAERAGLVRKFFYRLRSRNRWRKAQAAESLGYFGGPEAVGPVSSLLSYDDETVRAVAARALARIGTPEAAEKLAVTLNDPSELTRLRMAENLERLGGVAASPLIETLGSGDQRARVLAARVLGNLRAAEARPALHETLAAPDGETAVDLRAQATLALGRIGDPEDVHIIIASSESEDWPVRAQAANALEAIGDVSSIPALRRLMIDPEWWVRMNASRALANMGPTGERALVEVLEGADRFARDRAASSLEARGITRRAAGALAEDGERGENARRLIRAMARAGSVRYLGRLAETMPEGEARMELLEILESGGEPPRGERPTAIDDQGTTETPAEGPDFPRTQEEPGREIVPVDASTVPERRPEPSSLSGLVRRHPVAGAAVVAGIALGIFVVVWWVGRRGGPAGGGRIAEVLRGLRP